MLRLFVLSCLSVLLLACNNSNAPESGSQAASTQKPVVKTILVTGITGRQGGAVAHAVLQQGFKVRGLSRDPHSPRALAMTARGVKMVKGDFDDIASLDVAMQGVDGVFSVQDFWEHGYEGEIRQGVNVADAAMRAGISHLVYSSVAGADRPSGIPHFHSKYEIEEYIRSLGIAYTILRPVSFMENWEYARDSIIAGKLRSPFSIDTRLQQISVRDIGRFAALAFKDPANWVGVSLDIAGDEFTMKAALNLFSQITGSPVEYVQIPWDEYEKSAGEEMTIMDRWIESVGYSANINLVRSRLPDMLTLEDYLYQSGW